MKTYPSRLAMIAELPNGSVGAEIGVYRGSYSRQVLDLPNVAKLFLVDPWTKYEGYNDTINAEDQEAHYQETRRQVAPELRSGRCEIIRGFSVEVANMGSSPVFDFCTIDAYHAYEAALADVTAWSKRMNKGGVMFMHDYFEGPRYGHQGHTWYSGVVAAAAQFCLDEGWFVTAVTTEDLPTAKLERIK